MFGLFIIQHYLIIANSLINFLFDYLGMLIIQSLTFNFRESNA